MPHFIGTPGYVYAYAYGQLLALSVYRRFLEEGEDFVPRYVELLAGALKISPSESDYLADIDNGFYASEYLRAWAFEAQLRTFLREKFGNAWFTRKDAGSLIRELWSEGQKPTADEILHEVTGETLELEAAAERIREALAAV